MKKKDARLLVPGLYRIHWKKKAGGETSLAAVGVSSTAGHRQFAYVDNKQEGWLIVSTMWKYVKKVELIHCADDEVEDDPLGLPCFQSNKLDLQCSTVMDAVVEVADATAERIRIVEQVLDYLRQDLAEQANCDSESTNHQSAQGDTAKT